jgi:hypothetical protein
MVLLNYKAMGIPTGCLGRDINQDNLIFDLLISIANTQNEKTSDPNRMTRIEKSQYAKEEEVARKKAAKQKTAIKNEVASNKAAEKERSGLATIADSTSDRKRTRLENIFFSIF